MIDPGFILMMYMRSKNLIKINDMELTLDELRKINEIASEKLKESCSLSNTYNLWLSIAGKTKDEYEAIRENACESQKAKRDIDYFLSRIHSITHFETSHDGFGFKEVKVKVLYPTTELELLYEFYDFLDDSGIKYVIERYKEN